jgi:hypothetical protein
MAGKSDMELATLEFGGGVAEVSVALKAVKAFHIKKFYA